MDDKFKAAFDKAKRNNAAANHSSNFANTLGKLLKGKVSVSTAVELIKESAATTINAAPTAAQPTAEKEIIMSATTKQNTPSAPVKPPKANAVKPAAKKEEVKPAEPTKEELISAATNMNDIMGLEPKINVKINPVAIARDIMKNAAEIAYEDYVNKDTTLVLSDSTKATLALLGFNAPEKPAAPTKKEEVKPEPKKAAVKKASDMKAEKAAAATKKADKIQKYGRIESIADAIAAAKKSKKHPTHKDLIDASAKLYADKNGLDYQEEYSNTWLKAALAINVKLGAASFDATTKKYDFNV